jgi:uncharacterized protein DUF2878
VKPLWNFLAFQAGWFATVLLAAEGRPLLGAICTLPLIALHLAFVAQPRREAIFLLVAGGLGCLCDAALGLAGWIQLTGTQGLGPVFLFWFAALWANFATTIDISLRWLQPKPGLGLVFGLVGGPAAYWAGERLGAVSFPDGRAKALIAIALIWAVATPLLTETARRRGEKAA